MVSIGNNVRQHQRSSFFSRTFYRRTMIALAAAALMITCRTILQQHQQQQQQQGQQLEQDLLLVTSTPNSAKQEQVKANPLQTKDESPQNAGGAETTEAQKQYKEKKPLGGWIYEPKNVQFFWQKMGDRPFQREFYSQHLGKYKRILDIGVRGYNRYCKDLINSTSTEYFQMEPHPPAKDEMNNDGLLETYVEGGPGKYPDLKNSFDLVIDFGVFGWEGVQVGLTEEGIKKYVDAVRFFLKDRGCWTLKIDKGWVPNQQDFFEKHILPYFEMGDFDNAYKSGHKVKGDKFQFYFFYKK